MNVTCTICPQYCMYMYMYMYTHVYYMSVESGRRQLRQLLRCMNDMHLNID